MRWLSGQLLPTLAIAAAVDQQLGAAHLYKRAACGQGIGSCPSGQCCSESGWCGTGNDYCAGSQCQLDYSDSCDTLYVFRDHRVQLQLSLTLGEILASDHQERPQKTFHGQKMEVFHMVCGVSSQVEFTTDQFRHNHQ